jgi:TatD family-associated radical SAM protein
MDTLVYKIGNNLYINLTNRCSNSCTFCVRDQSAQYEGYPLWLKNGEPTVEQIIEKIGDPKAYNEIVFCGYGEPTYRVDAIKSISDYVHANGGKTRMNTNGHGNLINGRNIAEELVGKLDGINISLNAPDENSYKSVCRPHIDGAFQGLIDFAVCCKNVGLNCWFSVVDCIGEEALNDCRKIAEKVGIPLRVREYIG